MRAINCPTICSICLISDLDIIRLGLCRDRQLCRLFPCQSAILKLLLDFRWPDRVRLRLLIPPPADYQISQPRIHRHRVKAIRQLHRRNLQIPLTIVRNELEPHSPALNYLNSKENSPPTCISHVWDALKLPPICVSPRSKWKYGFKIVASNTRRRTCHPVNHKNAAA